jgi:hypothetical protein
LRRWDKTGYYAAPRALGDGIRSGEEPEVRGLPRAGWKRGEDTNSADVHGTEGSYATSIESDPEYWYWDWWYKTGRSKACCSIDPVSSEFTCPRALPLHCECINPRLRPHRVCNPSTGSRTLHLTCCPKHPDCLYILYSLRP